MELFDESFWCFSSAHRYRPPTERRFLPQTKHLVRQWNSVLPAELEGSLVGFSVFARVARDVVRLAHRGAGHDRLLP